MIDAVDVLEQATFLNPLNSFSNSPEFYGTDSSSNGQKRLYTQNLRHDKISFDCAVMMFGVSFLFQSFSYNLVSLAPVNTALL